MPALETLSLAKARRIALAAQGLDRPRKKRVTRKDLADLIKRQGLIQLDFVNVLVPAHYQIQFARFGTYPRERLHEVLYHSGEFHEQWAREASVLPNESWPLFAERRRTFRTRPWGFQRFIEEQPDYVAWVLKHLRKSGPIVAAELPTPEGVARELENLWPAAETHSGWYRSVTRATLDFHHTRGRVAVCDRRPDFTRIYDLIERHVPADIRRRRVDPLEAQRQLMLKATQAHGLGVAADLADHFRLPVKEARPRLEELVERGDLEQARVEGWREPAFLDPKAKRPRRIDAATLLSPFDPVIWFRPRVARLFEFQYRVELFVPAAKREYGYYVLPFLLDDRLVARVDLKAERDSERLAVLGAWHEDHADPRRVVGPLADELRQWAEWLQLPGLRIGRKGNLASALRRAL